MLRRSRLVMIILPALATVALGSALLSIARSNTAAGPTPAPAGAAGRANAVAGSGLVEAAGRDVSVATAVSGVVREVRVRSGDRVEKGDLLFVIDDQTASATVDQRRQDLLAAEARLDQTAARVTQLRAEAAAARGAVQAAEADRDEARDQADSGAQLVGAALSQRELTRRRNSLRTAESRLGEAQARLDAALAALALIDPAARGATYRVDQQAVAQARAALAAAETERDRLSVRAPQAGTVLTVDVRPGEFASQGATVSPVKIGLLTPLHVRVDVDEADIPRLTLGAPAVAARRGAAGERIPLRFLRAEPLLQAKRSLTGGPDERVDTRVLQLLYEVQTTDVDLRPGQVLDVTIEAGPAAAVR